MVLGQRFAQALAWVDIETTGLFQDPSTKNLAMDPSADEILEVAVIVTDFDLQPQTGYQSVVKLDRHGLERLRANPEVAQMHAANGLIKECRAADAPSLAQVDDELDAMLRETTTFEKGEFMIAGSGVAQFDQPLIRARLPKFASWLVYYPFDIGVYRRVTKILAGRDLVNRTPLSYGDAKLHRAYSDVEAHLEEASKHRVWLRGIDK